MGVIYGLCNVRKCKAYNYILIAFFTQQISSKEKWSPSRPSIITFSHKSFTRFGFIVSRRQFRLTNVNAMRVRSLWLPRSLIVIFKGLFQLGSRAILQTKWSMERSVTLSERKETDHNLSCLPFLSNRLRLYPHPAIPDFSRLLPRVGPRSVCAHVQYILDPHSASLFKFQIWNRFVNTDLLKET